MKKWSFLMLFALLLMPLSAKAEELPDVLGAVMQGLSEGLSEGAQAAVAAQELTLTMTAEAARIEEGRALTLTIAAGNPYPAPANVTLTLELPERLSCAQPLTWSAQLDAASADPQSGELVPSVTTFTREVTLLPGGGSEETQLLAELSMGTRFYRAALPLELCVPDVSAKAVIEGAQQFVEAGDSFDYVLTVSNTGSAPKDVPVILTLPDGVSPAGALPAGFSVREESITGAVRAEIAGECIIRLPMRVNDDVLDGDEDALRLLRGELMVNDERVSLPMLKAVGAMISAKLTPQITNLKEGETTSLTITVANTGLAAADVEISCLLPEGLTVLHDLTKAPAAKKDISKESGETDEDAPIAASAPDGGEPPSQDAVQAVHIEAAEDPVIREEDGLVLLSLRMDGAKETQQGVAAATREVVLRVRADAPLTVNNRLLGAALAWKTGDTDTHLGEAVALEVTSGGLMGLSHSEWNGILLAALLMLVTVCCLYSAVKSDNKQDDYCFE